MRLFGRDDRLFGRESECATLDSLIAGARSRHSAALVLRGEPGVGKTALLRYAESQVPEALTIRGVESESGFPYAGLHRLLIPLLPERDRLPPSQRAALEVACGLTEGPSADLFLVSLASLTLLATAPRLCVVDDVQWLDNESARALAFVARRLHAEGVVLLFGLRGDDPGLFAGIPDLIVSGLTRDASIALLSDVVTDDIDLSLAEHIAETTGGNPLALTDLGRELTADQWRGASPLPEPVPIGSRLESHYSARVRGYPPPTRTWLLLAAAGAGSRGEHLLAAARLLGTRPEDAGPAEGDRLVTGSPPVDFRHPLVRSAVYGDAPPAQRRAVHAALAAATIDPAEADRRAWHLASAAAAPDEQVAAELERRAGRAGARGGYAARVTFLNRAAELTPDPAIRAGRQVDAAAAAMTAGAPARALSLLDVVEEAQLAGPVLGSALLTRALATVNTGAPTGLRDAAGLCLEAAAAFGADHVQARRATVQAVDHAIGAERLGSVEETRVAAEAARLAGTDPDGLDGLLLAGYSAFILGGYRTGAPAMRRAVAAVLDPAVPDETLLRRFVVAVNFSNLLWDDASRLVLLDRAESAARRTGALYALDLVHFVSAMTDAALGRLDQADRHDATGQRIRRSIGQTADQEQVWRHPELVAWRAPDGFRDSAAQALQVFEMLHLGAMHSVTVLATAILEIASRDYPAAHDLLLRIVDLGHPRRYAYALPDLVEAALRAGDRPAAARALDDLAVAARSSATPLALGVLARSDALLAAPERAEPFYREAIDLLGATASFGDLARARLLYGEWLRRRRRRRDARDQLTTALEMFEAIQAGAFVERARSELAALGESVRSPVPSQGETALTPQEAAVARLARAGATNGEIAAHLFLSASTVDYHLRKVFRKLGVASRRQLREVFQD
ncbi:DNA-binding CsgD family transcriptional regulator [Actinoplanes lutulentus]|uniref:Regulatory LuxR family protein n=1 Tax=Actinoplanes lutulentus TaxID=1287878 RepID=A0A327YYV0_9ACTN|nr:LuxR family transcriptional regulator [Actinoplanes lutulentus]MBB2942142.1 DNA-binding CsgD family transcriptional regulator [Actinoplanes lutulentus]RAK26904.1 regulatory LuxR family protein [Actinoplanes lutulentus]